LRLIGGSTRLGNGSFGRGWPGLGGRLLLVYGNTGVGNHAGDRG
jgi:hypothetical protein